MVERGPLPGAVVWLTSGKFSTNLNSDFGSPLGVGEVSTRREHR